MLIEKLVILGILSLIFLGACMAYPKREITTQIDLPASPEQVWAILTDTGSYENWNPFIVKSEGTIAAGQRITNTMVPTPEERQTFRPKVLVAEPGEELRWLGRLGIPGLFDGEHYFLLSESGDQTHLIHGERFSGFFLWFIDVSKFERNFIEMNTALQHRVASTLGKPTRSEEGVR